MLIKKIGVFCNEFGTLDDGKIYEVADKVGKHLIKIEAAEKYDGDKAGTPVEFEIIPASGKKEKEEEKAEEVKE